MTSIAFQGALTVEDYLVTDRLYLRTYPLQGKVEGIWFIILGVGLGLALLHGVNDGQRLLSIGLVAGVPGLLSMGRAIGVRNAWKNNRTHGQTIYKGTVTARDITLFIGTTRITSDWALFGYYQATRDILLMYFSPYSVITLTSRLFSTPSEWNEVRTLVTNHIPAKFPESWVDRLLLFQIMAAFVISSVVVLMIVYLP